MDPCWSGWTYKVHTNGADVALRVSVVRKSEQQAGFADARVANEQQFEQVIATIGHSMTQSWSILKHTIQDSLLFVKEQFWL